MSIGGTVVISHITYHISHITYHIPHTASHTTSHITYLIRPYMYVCILCKSCLHGTCKEYVQKNKTNKINKILVDKTIYRKL